MATGSHAPAHRSLYPERFDMIDAFRGLAALAVVVHHVFGGADERFQIGHVAVLVFFVISGYCIASAADACQRKGLTFAQFTWRRVRRIYPPYLLSLVFWAATRVLKWQLDHVNDLNRPLAEWIQNVTLTQWISLLWHPMNFASDNKALFVTAYWSLNYEEQFYLVFGLVLLIAGASRLGVRAMVAGLVALSMIWIAVFPTQCYGLFIEYWAMFGVGALVFYRLCRLQTALSRRLAEAALVGILALSLGLRMAGVGAPPALSWLDWVRPAVRVGWGDLTVAAAFAVLLLVLRPADGWYKRRRWLSLPLGSLGMITYSLYLVHQFNLHVVSAIQTKGLALVGIHEIPLAVSGVVQCALHVCIGAVFWYFCERPFLNKSLLPPSGLSGEKPPAGAKKSEAAGARLSPGLRPGFAYEALGVPHTSRQGGTSRHTTRRLLFPPG